MGTKLYVGNLSYSTTEESLREAFGGDGRQVVSVSIITDRETGRPRGFAFVQLATDAEAQAALAAMDGQELDGRTLRVSEAQDKRRDGAGPPARGDRGPPGPRRNGPPVSVERVERPGREDRGRGRDRDRDDDRGGRGGRERW